MWYSTTTLCDCVYWLCEPKIGQYQRSFKHLNWLGFDVLCRWWLKFEPSTARVAARPSKRLRIAWEPSWKLSGGSGRFRKIGAYVIGFGKTLRMWFFPKIKFDVWLISPTIELTYVQVLDRSRASLWSYKSFVCDRATPPTIKKLRSKGVTMHAYDVAVYDACTGSQ